MTGRFRAAGSGAIAGLTAWLAYFAAELLAIRLIPALGGAIGRDALPWDANLAFLAMYGALGIALGAGAAILVSAVRQASRDPNAAVRVAAVAAMLLAMGAVQAAGDGRHATFAAAFLAAGFAAVAVVLIPFARRFQPLFGHGTVAVAFGAGVCLSRMYLGDFQPATKAVALLAWLALVLVAGASLRALGRRLAGRPGPGAHLVIAAAAALLAIVCSELLAPRPLRTAPALAAGPGRSSPHVILIVLDTVRADRLSVYGHGRDTTPALRAFARTATLYRNVAAASDMTLASHASMFTGQFASWHGAHVSAVNRHGAPLGARHRVMAEMLQAAGYRTAAVVANYAFFSPEWGFARGFEHYDARSGTMFLGFYSPVPFRERLRRIAARAAGRDPDIGKCRHAGQITAEAIRLLPESGPAPPLFLFLNYMDAHDPYAPPAPYDRMFPGWEFHLSAAGWRRLIGEVNRGRRAITGRERAYGTSQYDGALAYLDSRLAELFDQLRRRRLYDDSLIIMTSDHGEAFGERDLMEHGVSVYEDQVRVPLLVKWPGQTAGRVVEERASHVDLLPTVLAAAGLPPLSGSPGVDLARMGGEPRFLYSESFPSGSSERFRRTERAAFHGDYKLIVSDKGKRELYNLSADPQEQVDLYQAGDRLSQALVGQLTAWVRRLPAGPIAPAGVDASAAERLRSLGYIQ
jgi:arylsulfatase A-like enzyme